MINQHKILIIGFGGQLGSELAKKYPRASKIDIDELDISNRNSVYNYDFSVYEYVINAAAYTNVDGAETNDGRIISWKANANAPLYLAQMSNKYGFTLVHVSSDYVFDGQNEIHSEEEDLSPVNVYGSTKAAGDLAVMSAKKYYILRTSWVIGKGKNFINTMIDVANKGIDPRVVDDQIGRLTFTSEITRAISYLLENKTEFGIYNISNSGEGASWADITEILYKYLKLNNKVHRITTSEYFKDKPNIALRPHYSTLDLKKINSIGFESTDWKLGLAEYLKENI